MTIFFVTFVFFLVAILAMSVGYIAQRKKIGGSCGGLGALGVDKACDCPEPCDKRKDRIAQDRQQKREQWEKNRII